ncbi:hypothetical protein [Halorarum halobium]|uniref:hypothetical protein n=1 Tax=Halorarum halobium TaxID=3075121 RepID=UPI0028AA1BBE|nr:hypothetical protein [Halobaculum sp. XH14]
MGFPVTYYCPHCEALVELEREGYLDDKAVTPFPFEGWEYAAPDGAFEDADGVRFTCGRDGTLKADESGCGESFYLSFVRFVDGEELDPRRQSKYVELAERDDSRGPGGPGGPDGPKGGFY